MVQTHQRGQAAFRSVPNTSKETSNEMDHDGFTVPWCGWTDLAITLSRIAVGAFFMLSGYHKLFNAERHRTFVDELKALGVPAVGFNQWWVPLVEFTAGGAVLLGLLAPLAALGLLVPILVAIATSGSSESNSTSRSMKRIASTIGSIYRRRFTPSC